MIQTIEFIHGLPGWWYCEICFWMTDAQGLNKWQASGAGSGWRASCPAD
jgi:hypothetical protein